MRLMYHLAKRFIAGESIEEMLPKVKALVDRGFRITADFVGESVSTRAEVEQATKDYLLLIQALHDESIECNVSVKLSQLGAALDPQLARDRLRQLVAEAQSHGGFVRVDMEGSDYTSMTLDIVTALHQEIAAVGTVVQSMLRRTPSDIAALCANGIRVRLVKGAYKESADVAYQTTSDVCAQFLLLTEQLLRDGVYPAIGTHDEALIDATITMVQRLGVGRDSFEFQMLYGIRPVLQERLLDDGWRVRIYVPYGSAWMPYFIRRLRERKENVWFVAKNLFRG